MRRRLWSPKRRRKESEDNPGANDYVPLGQIPRVPTDYSTYLSLPPINSQGQQGQQYMLAAATLVGSQGAYDSPQVMPWQTDVWGYLESIPQLAFAARRMSNALSRIELYVGLADTTDGVPDRIPASEEDDAQGTADTRAADRRALQPLAELFDGQHGAMLARIGGHLTLVGDSNICGFTDPATGQPGWYVASQSEITTNAGGADLIRDGYGGRIRINSGRDPSKPGQTQDGMVLRLWRPHLRFGWQADAPTRSLGGCFKELLGAAASVQSSLESRIAGAGVLVIPQSASVPSSKNSAGSQTDPMMAAIIDATMAPLKNPNSAAARVPLLMKVRDDAIGKIQHITFSTPLDERVLELREFALRQLAISLDQPAEVMLGLGDSNHWNVWAITEDEIKMTIAPMCEVICAAITEKYLWPRLQRLGIKDFKRYVIYFDVTQLAQRPNRAPDAQALHGMGLVKDATTRRESGFTEDDAPSEEEQQRNLLIRLMTAGVPIDQAVPYLKLLKFTLPEDLLSAAPADTGGGEQPSDDAEQQPPEGGTPDKPGPPGTPGNPANPVQPGAPSASGTPAAVAAVAASARLALVGAAHGQHP